METQKQNKIIEAFIQKMLYKYCKTNAIKLKDIKGISRENGLPTHRHIFAYCMREYYHFKYRHIGTALNKSQILYGIKTIRDYLHTYKDIEPDHLPEHITLIKIRIKTFMAICQQNPRPHKRR